MSGMSGARRWALAMAGLLAAMPLAARAQFEADSSAPIEITSDTMEWMNEQRVAVARGNADAVQGRYRLNADVLTAYMNENGDGGQNRIKRITANGHVKLTTPQESASGSTGVYDVEAGQVTLEGGVVLTQGDNVLRGERLIMNLATGRSRLEGGPPAAVTEQPAPGGRVRAIFTPDKGASDKGKGKGGAQ